LTKNFKNLNVGHLRFLGFFLKTEKPIGCVNQSDASTGQGLYEPYQPALAGSGLIWLV